MMRFHFLFEAIFLLVLLLSDVAKGDGLLHKIQKAFSLTPKPLTDEARTALAARYTKEMDDIAWKDELKKMKAGDISGEMWFMWFTKGEEKSKDLDLKLDGAYNDTIITIAQSLEKQRKSPTDTLSESPIPLKPNFGRVDCSLEHSAPLCSRFFILPKTLPQLFTIVPSTTTRMIEVEYEDHNDTFKRLEIVENITVGLWKYPVNESTTSAEIVEFYENEGWKKLKAWDGWMNPVDGKFSSVGEHIGVLYRWYKLIPQWALMMGISFLAKHLTSKLIPATPSPKKEKKERRENDPQPQPSTNGVNKKVSKP